MSAIASRVPSSSGSRRPEELRQCTQARLHAQVSSHVRQIGASSPSSKRSRSELSAPIEHPGVEEPRERGEVAVDLLDRDVRLDGGAR